MVAAEERVAAENDVLAVHPILVLGPAVPVSELVLQVHIPSPLAQGASRYSYFIGEQVVAPLGPQGAGEAHKGHLNGSGPGGEHLVAGAASVTVQVDENVDPVADYLLDQLFCRPAAGVEEHRRLPLDLLAVRRVVAGRRSVAVCTHSRGIVQPENGLHEMS